MLVRTSAVTRLRPTAFTLARSAVVGETLTRRRGSRRPTTAPPSPRGLLIDGIRKKVRHN